MRADGIESLVLWPWGKKSWVLLLAVHSWADLGVAGAKQM